MTSIADAPDTPASGSFGDGVAPWLLLSGGLKLVGHIHPHGHHEPTWLFLLPLVVIALKLTFKGYRWQRRRRVAMTAYTRAQRASQRANGKMPRLTRR
jgi:hypothetical protein